MPFEPLQSLAAAAQDAADQGWLERNATLVVGVVGIIMSGFVGPSVTAWFTSRREEARDMRTLATAQLENLREVLDDAAKLLSNAVGQLRPLLAAAQEDKPLPKEPADFLSSFAPLGQRLRLRLPDTHPVVIDYENVTTRLREVARATATQSQFDAAVGRFETARDEFLESSRAELRADIFDSERAMPVGKKPALQIEPAPRSSARADHASVAGGSHSARESAEDAEPATPLRFADPPSLAPPEQPPLGLSGSTPSPSGSSSGGAGASLPTGGSQDARSRPEAGGKAERDESPEGKGE